MAFLLVLRQVDIRAAAGGPIGNGGLELGAGHAQVELQSVGLAGFELIAKDVELLDLVLDARAVGDAVRQIAGQAGVDSLHVVDNGDIHLLVGGDDEDRLGGIGVVEQVLSSVGNTRRSGLVLDDLSVQAGGHFALLLAVLSAFLAFLASIVEDNVLVAVEVLRGIVVEPVGLRGRSVVQVEGTLHGHTREGDAAHVNLGVGVEGVGGIGAVDEVINLHIDLSQGVLELEVHLAVDSGLSEVDIRQAGGQRGSILDGAVVSRGGHDTPEQVDGLGGVGVNDILDDGVAGGCVLDELGDALFLAQLLKKGSDLTLIHL